MNSSATWILLSWLPAYCSVSVIVSADIHQATAVVQCCLSVISKTGFAQSWFTSHYDFKIFCTILSAQSFLLWCWNLQDLKPIYFCIFPYMELLVELLRVALQLFHITSEKALPSLAQENYPGVLFQGQSITCPWEKSCHALFLFYHHISSHSRAFLLILGHFNLNHQTSVILVTLWKWWALGRYLRFSQRLLNKCLSRALHLTVSVCDRVLELLWGTWPVLAFNKMIWLSRAQKC